MTTLVGLHLEGQGTWLAADQQATSEDTAIGPIHKIVEGFGWAVAAAGYLRTINVLAEHRDRLFRGLKSPYEFTDRLGAIFERSGFSPNARPGPQTWGQSLLLTSPNGLWSIDTSLSICPIPTGQLWAEGSGRDYALGAGNVLCQVPGIDPAAIVQRSLETAMRYDLNTGIGMDIVHLVPPPPRSTKPRSRSVAK